MTLYSSQYGNHSEETTAAMAAPILTAEQEKELARDIELAHTLEALPHGNAAELTLAILLQLCRNEPAARRVAERLDLEIPDSLYAIATHRQFRESIDGPVAPEACHHKDPDFAPLGLFSATAALITASSWDALNEIVPEATADQMTCALGRPEPLLDALQPLIPDLARLHRSIHRNAAKARDTMAERNTRLVSAIAHKYVHPAFEYEDRFQEGCAGLVTAIEKFNHHRGLKFSTYATWWVRQAITRAIADQARTIRIPVHMVDKIGTLRRARQALEQDGHHATVEEIAEEMDTTPGDVQHLLSVEAQVTISLDQPINAQTFEVNETTLGELIPDRATPTEDQAVNRQFSSHIDQALNESVTPREKKVIQMRFGLAGYERMTLEQVGQELNVTRERIRQIQQRAMRKLKPALTRHGMDS